MQSCKKDSTLHNIKDGVSNSAITFNKADIPNTPEEFQKAVQLLLAFQNNQKNKNSAKLTAALPNVLPPTANYNYVRFKPADENQMLTLTEGGCNFELYEEPLHLEDFEYVGDDYIDPTIPDNQYPWFYTCVPVGYPLPAGIQYEIIQPLFLYNDDPNEPADNEDSWGGEIEDQPDSLSSTTGSRIANNVQSVTEWMQQNGNPIEKANIWITQTYKTLKVKEIGSVARFSCPVSPCDPDFFLYVNDPNFGCAGECGGTGGGTAGCSNTQTKFKPKGNLTVRNTSSNTNDALKGVKVRTRNGFKLGKAYTDANGHFEANKSYAKNKKVRVIVKFKSKNLNVKVRTVTTGMRIWQIMMPVKHKFDKMKNCALETINYTFANDGSRKSKATRKWATATFFNARYDFQKYSIAENITDPIKMSVWLTPNKSGSAMTAMSKRLFITPGSSIFNYITTLGNTETPIDPAITTIVVKIMGVIMPDMLIQYGSLNTTNNIKQTEGLTSISIHELGHAQHFTKMYYEQPITTASYWQSNIGYIVSNFGYGSKNMPGAQRCAIIEGWAYYLESFYMDKWSDEKYGSNDGYTNLNENQVPDLGSIGWFPWGMYHDLQDNTENFSITGVHDNVNTYTLQQVIGALKPNLNLVRDYSTTLLQQNANKQATDVNLLITDYQY